MPKNDKVLIATRVAPEMRAALKWMADLERRSMSAEIQVAVQKHVEAYEKKVGRTG